MGKGVLGLALILILVIVNADARPGLVGRGRINAHPSKMAEVRRLLESFQERQRHRHWPNLADDDFGLEEEFEDFSDELEPPKNKRYREFD